LFISQEELTLYAVQCTYLAKGRQSGAVWNRWTGLLDWTTGLEYWNDLWPQIIHAHVRLLRNMRCCGNFTHVQ